MAKVSVIIPASNEIYLQRTITELLNKAGGDIEVIPVLDGYWTDKPLEPHPNLIVLHKPKGGMRAAINAGIAISRGKYIMKIDAHCNIAPNYDIDLQKDMNDNWLVIPRRYGLDMETWGIRRDKMLVDYEYLSDPNSKRQMSKKPQLRAWKWQQRCEDRAHKMIDETMTFQGSCWFAEKDFFMKQVGYLDDILYGPFSCEAQEIGLKYWLGKHGGRIIVNKKTWYAHLWKGKPYREIYLEMYGRSYARTSPTQLKNAIAFSNDFWMNNKWEDRKYDLKWLIDRFAPVPTW